MTETLKVIYDGAVFRPRGVVHLEPNTELDITFETDPSSEKTEPLSSLKFLSELKLDGPADFSERIDDYLYGDAKLDDE